MKDWWIKFGCWLTGYNYTIVKECGETTRRSVKRDTSALVIIIIVWSSIGYILTSTYLHGGVFASIIGAIVATIIVIQIERQIILKDGKNYFLSGFRFLIAIAMSIIGSVLVDQKLFEEDVKLEKQTYNSGKIDEIFNNRSLLIDKDIEGKEKQKG